MSEPEKTIKRKEPDIDEVIYKMGQIKALGAFLVLASECSYNLNKETSAVGSVIENLAKEMESELVRE